MTNISPESARFLLYEVLPNVRPPAPTLPDGQPNPASVSLAQIQLTATQELLAVLNPPSLQHSQSPAESCSGAEVPDDNAATNGAGPAMS